MIFISLLEILLNGCRYTEFSYTKTGDYILLKTLTKEVGHLGVDRIRFFGVRRVIDVTKRGVFDSMLNGLQN